MKAVIAALVSLAIAHVVVSAEPVKVPERTPSQRVNRLLQFNANGVVLGIAFAKSRGSSVEEYARFCGDIFVPTWNRDNGFAGLALGVLANFDVVRRIEDSPPEILVQTDSMIRFKSYLADKRLFRDGKLGGITFDEYLLWIEVVYVRIAEYLGATYKQESSGDFMIVTVTKK